MATCLFQKSTSKSFQKCMIPRFNRNFPRNGKPHRTNVKIIFYLSIILEFIHWPLLTIGDFCGWIRVQTRELILCWFLLVFAIGVSPMVRSLLCWLRKCGCSCVFVFKENWLNIAWNIWSIQNIEYNVLYIKYKRYRNLWIIKFIQGQIYVGAEKVRLRCNFGSWFPLWHPIMVWRFIHLIEWLS